ncbi:MAG: 3-dehydroquinate synthase [Proteobacteria bacterium]|nr:3-dehydroquinate synthase [Pseudomonadota bacterium]
MKQIDVKTPTGAYPILIERKLRREIGKYIRDGLDRAGACIVVTNPTVGAHYSSIVVESLKRAGFQTELTEIPDGEQFKTLENIGRLYDRFLQIGLSRDGLVIALGGGVVGDMAGFAAATYMRGVRFIQVPTTLLAMVDASVGGKTGVDLPQGKNLVGAFKQPEMVLIDPDVLDTLPKEELEAGMAEVIKHGLIGNSELFERMENNAPSDFDRLIDEAVRVKVALVQRDPLEQNDRALLNLGHTFGHAFELLSNYGLRHGEAVAVGLIAATKMSADLGECDVSLVERVERAVKSQNLPQKMSGFIVDDVIDAMKHDKKRKLNSIRFIIPLEPGHTKIMNEVPDDVVRSAVTWVLGDLKEMQ